MREVAGSVAARGLATAALCLALPLALSACGQRGDLYLPNSVRAPERTAVLPVAVGPAGTGVIDPAQSAQLPQGPLRYQLSGSGPHTLVLLPGAATASLQALLPQLERTHQVLRYDARAGAPRIADEVADLAELLDTLQIREPVTLIGGSTGADMALHFAADHPGQTNAVMIIGLAGASPNDSSADRVDPQRIHSPLWVVAARPTGADEANAIATMQAMVDAIPGGRGHLEVLDSDPLTAIRSPELASPLLQRFLSLAER